MKSWMKLFASTMPSIENVNRLIHAKKRREPAVFAHVTEGINVNRAPTPVNDEHHHQAQRVELQSKINVESADGEPVDERFIWQNQWRCSCGMQIHPTRSLSPGCQPFAGK